MYPAFADLREVLSAFECSRIGHDVLLENPCNPYRTNPAISKLPYPRIWMALTPLGLNQSHTIFLGVVLVLLFYIVTFNLTGKLNFYESLIYSLILCSPPVMLLIERGNVDILIFLLLFISLIIILKSSRLISRLFAYEIILLAAFLKLFPIFGLTVILRERKRIALLLIAILTTLFASYYLLNLEELRAITGFFGVTVWHSFGYKVIFKAIFQSIKMFLYSPSKTITIKLLCNVTLILVACLVGYQIIVKVFQKFKTWLNCDFQSESDLNYLGNENYIDGFRLGCCLYIGAFSIGSVYDYKLVFWLFAIPQIIDWIKRKNQLSLLSTLALVGIIATLYLSPLSQYLSLDEIINWFLLGYFVYCFLLSLPKGLKFSVHNTLLRQLRRNSEAV